MFPSAVVHYIGTAQNAYDVDDFLSGEEIAESV
jgi:hypothetical protein